MPVYYDVFNGDADGICALHQLRLAEPREARLITGVKREIGLLSRLKGVSGATVTVLDISLDKNRQALEGLLRRNCRVFYADHHFAGDLPSDPLLTAHIDPAPDVCTSVIVDGLLAGRFRPWAVVAAFGDNLAETATRLAAGLGLAPEDIDRLRELGELLNYNSYGASMADLHYPPEELYRAVQPFAEPLAFIAASDKMESLRLGFADDMARARACEPLRVSPAGRIYLFPAEPWARRAAGVFMNERARERRELAHALLVDNGDGTLLVSVRAPLLRRTGADTLCRSFTTGGGRAAAAGINALPAGEAARFFQAFEEVFLS